jgi:hypothetical protein
VEQRETDYPHFLHNRPTFGVDVVNPRVVGLESPVRVVNRKKWLILLYQV